jgi:hypothetical protein
MHVSYAKLKKKIENKKNLKNKNKSFNFIYYLKKKKEKEGIVRHHPFLWAGCDVMGR